MPYAISTPLFMALGKAVFYACHKKTPNGFVGFSPMVFLCFKQSNPVFLLQKNTVNPSASATSKNVTTARQADDIYCLLIASLHSEKSARKISRHATSLYFQCF
ncbi:MAG: hypothetical protein PHN76_05615 [Advenella sp.]|uniref:hypothetical protein n=1 Tax=Advenella sp. TaxID=1872388 RepID=UPI0016BD0DC7|nr:hypothetical protein [Advenella sp.]MDD3757623.1 hypothetical protein [Advenella sp.]NLN68636.1 hypothetical protein [Alcaligenaceae bacterium]